MRISTAQTYEQTQLLLLKNISQDGLTYTCPFSPNPEKIVFVDIPSRQIVHPTTIDCHQQYPVYIQRRNDYYEITNQGNLIKLENQHVNTERNFRTTQIKLPNDHWEEKIPQTVHYDTMPTIIAQARHQQFEQKIIQAQLADQRIEQLDVQQLRNIIKNKERIETQNWNEILQVTNSIQERQKYDYNQYRRLYFSFNTSSQTYPTIKKY